MPTLPSELFFGTLWYDVRCEFFCDPLYGGNRNMEGWRMIGFSGAYTDLRPHLGGRREGTLRWHARSPSWMR